MEEYGIDRGWRHCLSAPSTVTGLAASTEGCANGLTVMRAR